MQDMINDTEVLGAITLVIDNAIGYAPIEGENEVVFIMSNRDYIGELCKSLYYIRNLYSGQNVKFIFIVIPVARKTGQNDEILKFMVGDGRLIESYDPAITKIAWLRNINPIRKLSRTYLLGEYIYERRHNAAIRQGYKPPHFPLTADILERGQALRRRMSIPADAPIVTLHVREASLKPEAEVHDYRDADINKYSPTLRYLVEQGYYVVRIGDPTMRKLRVTGEQVIDLPHHPSYEPLADLYFMGVSQFYIGMKSGPYSLAEVLGVRRIVANMIIEHETPILDTDILLPKHVFSHKLGRCLTYLEFVSSEYVKDQDTAMFRRAGLSLLENSEEEILAATKEMVATINGTYAVDDETVERYHRQNAIAQLIRSQDPASETQYFMPAFSRGRISQEFVRLNPWCLGH